MRPICNLKELKRLGVILLSLYVLVVSVKETPSLLIFQFKRSSVQKEIKQKIKNGIPNSQLTPFAISDLEKAKWEKPGKEFWLNKQIYDVIRIEKKENNILVWCFEDVKERGLFAELKQLLDEAFNEMTVQINEEEPLLQLYSEQESILPVSAAVKIESSFYIHPFPQGVFIPFLTPPPEELNDLIG